MKQCLQSNLYHLEVHETTLFGESHKYLSCETIIDEVTVRCPNYLSTHLFHRASFTEVSIFLPLQACSLQYFPNTQ